MDAMGLFHKDQMTLQLEKYDFKPGDVIKGYLKLNLRKPHQARKLTVSFRGTRIDTVMVTSHDSKGIPSTHMQKIKTIIYNFEQPLDDENTYLTEMYPFEIKIPTDLLATINLKQPVHNLTLMGHTLPIAMGNQPLSTILEWTVNGQLDIPLNIDVRAEQQIVVSP
jgi:hypothetical protein